MYVCVHAQATSKRRVSSFSPWFLRQGLSLNLELTNLAELIGQQAPGMLLSPPPQGWDSKHVPPSMCEKGGRKGIKGAADTAIYTVFIYVELRPSYVT